MATEQREDGKLIAVAGASRWGKTAWVVKQIEHLPRVLVWDVRGEYNNVKGFQAVQTIPDLAERLRDTAKAPARLNYWGPLADFDQFCRCAFLWVQLWPSVIVVEEMSDVTRPGKAPAGWGELVRKGLYYGAHVYAVTQRPQECDSTTWGNASVIHATGLVRPDDQAYMARVLGVDLDLFAALQKGQYLERRAGDTEVKKGRIF